MVLQTYIAAALGNVITFVSGTSLAWSSPILPKFNVTDVDDIPFGRRITDDENSWLGSLLSLGAIFGPFVSGFLADKIGRKWTLLCLAVPFLVAYVMMAFAQEVALFYVARILVGFGTGGVFTVIPMYVGEIAEDSNRGALGSVMNVLLTFGLLFTYAIAPYVSILAFHLVLAVVPGVFIAAFFLLAPETPHYYISKGNDEAATQSLEKLRGSGKTSNELDDIKKAIEQAGKSSVFDLFKSKGLIKALIISLALVSFQQLSGINAVLSYAQLIFAGAGGGISAEVSAIIIGAVLFSTSFITPLFVDKFGRKILLYISSIGMLVSEVPLGVYFYMQDDGQDVDDISWLPVVALVVYIICYNCGFGPLPWAIMGEIFPANVKSAASSVTAGFCWFISFIITKFFQSLVDAIGMGPSFWLFASFCGLAFVFTLVYVVETKGKSLQEIQDILEK